MTTQEAGKELKELREMAINLINELDNEKDSESRILNIMECMSLSFVQGVFVNDERKQKIREGLVRLGELLE